MREAPPLELADIIDAPSIQRFMEDFHALARIPMAVIDLKGKILVGVGWQDVCTKFHRAHPETCRNCVASDTKLSAGLAPGEHRLYKCANNMWDAATPIIVGGRHAGNVFCGQFFFADEQPDRELFRRQAGRYGFPEAEYLAALDRVPRLSRAQVDAALGFFQKLADHISQLSWSGIQIAREVAERKRTEESLRRSEGRLARAQEISHLGGWELDLVNNELSWSDEVYRIFGLSPQGFAATYEAFLAVVHPDDRAAVDEAYSGSLREGRDSYEIEHRIIRKSTGELRFVHEKCEHLRDGAGKIIRSVGMVHDITERIMAEGEVRRAKEDWERTFDSVPDLIAIIDERHRVVRVNAAMARRLGREPAACVGLPCHEAVHGLDAPPGFCPHARTLRDGCAYAQEVREKRLGGDFLVTTTPLRDARGCMLGSVHVAHDITERKKKEEELRRLNRTLRALSRSDQALTHASSEQGYIDEVCRIVVEDCGHAMVWIGFAEQDEAKTVRPAASAGFAQGYLETLKVTWADTELGRGPTGTAIRTGKPCTCRNMQTDPAFKPWRAEAVKRGYASSLVLPLLEKGKVFGTINIYSREPDPFSEDETRQLGELADSLAQGIVTLRLRAAHAEAEEARRRQAEEIKDKAAQLEAANKELESFSYSVSHDLRAPLRHINGFVGLLGKRTAGSLDEPSRRYLELISDSARRMGDLIDDLLAFSRLGRSVLRLSAVDLDALVRAVREEVRPDADAREIEWRISALPKVQGDPALLRVVLTNLISNAVKFTRRRERALIEIGAQAGAPGRVEVFVRDNGAGFDMRYAGNLFGVFQRLHRSEEFEGTGIGLATVRRIITRHEGTVRAEGVPDEGAAFYFSLRSA